MITSLQLSRNCLSVERSGMSFIHSKICVLSDQSAAPEAVTTNAVNITEDNISEDDPPEAVTTNAVNIMSEDDLQQQD